jgi:hypothetical protein
MAVEAKRPLEKGKYVWVLSRKDGKYRVIIGPDPLDASEDDMPIVADAVNPMKMISMNSASEAIQDFITLNTGEYAVVHSPAELSPGSDTDTYPNGNFQNGKNEMKSLQLGKKRVITSGHFPLWPGQRVEIRKMHELSSNQYLMVVVESTAVDTKAPYYDLTGRCAGIKRAVVDETVGSEGEGVEEKIKIANMKEEAALAGTTDESETGAAGAADATKEKEAGKVDGAKREVAPDVILKVGQKIIIPGSLTPTYIPPTGIEVVAEGNLNEVAVVEDDLSSPVDFVGRMIADGFLKVENLRNFTDKAGIGQEYYDEVEKAYKDLRRERDGKKALSRALSGILSSSQFSRLATALTSRAKESEKDDLVVRDAVVLGPTEFCVLFDEDGKPRTHKGPGRVFPGPYDIFRTEGSRNRIYDAYHLREDRGLLLRVVADRISRKDLEKQLPEGSGEALKGKEAFTKGDEIFIGGFDSYLVPSSSIEVINPETRQPHIGNDHSEVYVQSIGVDQKSGVYVASVATGNVRLEKGEKKLLLDPRKDKHVKRLVPARMWNLIIGEGEPHKKTSQPMVNTPWALSVPIFNNKAALVTGKDSRRVVVGPCTELLSYEEWLEVLNLSKGRPKSEEAVLETCFLRVKGNRITDQIRLETADFISIDVDVCYGVEFIGDTQEEMIKWFNYRNYVMLLYNNLRSRLRSAARKMTLKDIYPVIPDFVRDTILGEKPRVEDGREAHRPGLKFEENNMLVNEVEVLSIKILDAGISDMITKQNRTVIQGEMEVSIARAGLQTLIASDEIDKKSAVIKVEKVKRDREAELQAATGQHEVDKKRRELAHAISMMTQQSKAALDKATEMATSEMAAISRTRDDEDAAAELTRVDERRQRIIEFRDSLKDIEVELIEATSKADVDRLNAIQKGLIEALEGMGNKQLAASLAEHLPQATGTLGLLLGQGGLNAVMKMMEGTPIEKAINALKDSAKTVEAAAMEIQRSSEED